MAQPAPARPKINTKSTQARNVPGETRESARGWTVIELDSGIPVYPPQEAEGRWRAVWTENGRRRYCEAVTEAKLATKLAKVTERLEADASAWNGPALT